MTLNEEDRAFVYFNARDCAKVYSKLTKDGHSRAQKDAAMRDDIFSEHLKNVIELYVIADQKERGSIEFEFNESVRNYVDHQDQIDSIMDEFKIRRLRLLLQVEIVEKYVTTP